MKRAFVCPGQGSQSIGMGKEVATNFPASKAIFEEVDEALDENLSKLIWEGSIETLTLTENAQPALMATSLAIFRALESEGISTEMADYVAGHSLGEYSALALSKAITVGEAARLLRLRGKAMQNAVPVGQGAMAAILGLNFEQVKEIAAEAKRDVVCQAANDNDPTQIVVSGNREAVERAIDLAKKMGARRAIILPVSAPFHCALMAPAADVMKKALADIIIKKPDTPLITNVLAKPVNEPDAIRDLLFRQITNTVKWRESIKWMFANGVREIWEIGSGRALSGMIRRIEREIGCRSIERSEDIRATKENIYKGK